MEQVGQLQIFAVCLAATWTHRSLPNGEYPKTVEQLIEAYPYLKDEKYEIENRISEFTGKPSIMVRTKVDTSVKEKLDEILRDITS